MCSYVRTCYIKKYFNFMSVHNIWFVTVTMVPTYHTILR